MKKENVCPNCGLEVPEGEIEVEDSGIEDGSYYYQLSCTECHCTFRQYYKLVWDGNYLIFDPKEE